MQESVVEPALVMISLFFIGLVLTILIIARYVPEFGLQKEFALSQEELQVSRLPVWTRMVVLPIAASTLPVILPLSLWVVEP